MGLFEFIGKAFSRDTSPGNDPSSSSSGGGLVQYSGNDIQRPDRYAPHPDDPQIEGVFRTAAHLKMGDLPLTDPGRAKDWERALKMHLANRKKASKAIGKALASFGKIRQLDAADTQAFYRAKGADAQAAAQSARALHQYQGKLHQLKGQYSQMAQQLAQAQQQQSVEFQQRNDAFSKILGGNK